MISGRERVVPMTLERALGYESEAVEKIVLLVFSCDHLPDGEALERNLSISVDVGSVSGIYVPRSAVAYMDGQRGVYILKGSVVQFRAIEVAYIGKDYYLVEADFDDDEYLNLVKIIYAFSIQTNQILLFLHNLLQAVFWR